MTTAQVVEASDTVNNNSPIQNYVHPDDQTQLTYDSWVQTFHEALINSLNSTVGRTKVKCLYEQKTQVGILGLTFDCLQMMTRKV